MDRIRHGDGEKSARKSPIAWLAIGLIAITAIAFGPAVGNGFVNLDDPANLVGNAALRASGFEPIRWAWTTRLLGVYQPIGWMIFEAQYRVFGLNPRGYHLASMALHSINGVLLFVLCRQLLARSGSGWSAASIDLASAFAAGFWLIHPLRVEAVAWASCQPYLPAATFVLLSLIIYIKAYDSQHNRWWLPLAMLCVAAAGLCKGAALGVVGVFLVLDVYPLKRLDVRAWVEKLPIVVFGLILALVGARSKGLASREIVEERRIFEAVARIGYAALFYPGKTIWPTNLCVHYGVSDRPDGSILWYLAGSVVALGLSLVVVVRRRQMPWLCATWLAYLALLAPTLGLSAFGHVIAADRYAYLAAMAASPLIAAGICRLAMNRRFLIWSTSCALVFWLMAATRVQCRTWLDGESLWAHALRVDGDKTPQPRDGLAEATLEAGKPEQAIFLYETALRNRPNDPFARTGLGLALYRRGDRDASIFDLKIAAGQRPGDFPTQATLGAALLQVGRAEEALPHLLVALDLRPNHVDSLVNLGLAYLSLNRFDESSARFSQALRLDPDHPGAIGGLARVERKRSRGVFRSNNVF